MPMSTAERQRKHREKLKSQEPDKYEERKRKHAEYMKNNRKLIGQLSAREQNKRRKQWREANARRNSNKGVKKKNEEPKAPPKTDENSDEETSDLWSYFERDGAGRARCAICCTKVYSHAAALTAHLKSKHPKLLSEPMSPQGSDNQNEDEEEAFTDVIYLEEETPNTKETPVKEKIDLSYSIKNQPSTSKNSARKRSQSQSSDEIVYKKKRNTSDRRPTSFKKSAQDDDDTEIESFGSYVVCLLKKLPRNVSMKLQRDIINLIMNENLNEASNEMPNKIVLDGNKIYMVSNNDGTASKISDATDTLENHSYDKVTMNDNENRDSDARSAKNMLD